MQLPVKAIGANCKSLQQIIPLDTINFGDDCEHGHSNFVSWDDILDTTNFGDDGEHGHTNVVSWDDILDTTNFGDDCEHSHTTFASWDDNIPMINNIEIYVLEADPTIYTTIQAM